MLRVATCRIARAAPCRARFATSAEWASWVPGVRVAPEDELVFCAITPFSVAKARTGAILSRILCKPGLDLVGARMYAPSDQLITRLQACNQVSPDPVEARFPHFLQHELSRSACSSKGYHNRSLLLLLKGKSGALQCLNEIVGAHTEEAKDFGRTIRGTFGEYFQHSDGLFYKFQPAVITARNADMNRNMLRAFADYADQDGGVIEPFYAADESSTQSQCCLVMLKPDNFARPSSRPGHIVDRFEATGLHMVAAQMFSMSNAQAVEFYGFLRDVFPSKLSFLVEKRIRNGLAGMFDFDLSENDVASMADILKDKNAECELAKILSYMTGVPPSRVAPSDREIPGPAKCLAMIFRGPNAIATIRDTLGATDPQKATAGSIRADYGLDLMHNGAHASDSEGSCERERRIVRMSGQEPSQERLMIFDWLAATEKR